MERILINVENNQEIFQEELNEIETVIKSSLYRAFDEFLKDYSIEVFVLLTDNEEIRQFNKEQRNIDKATDVLSFPLLDLYEGDGDIDPEDFNPENDSVMLGDIIISLEKAKEQSVEYGHSFLREVAFLATHGAFHLLGYDHDTPEREKIMMELQERVLNDLGLKR